MQVWRRFNNNPCRKTVGDCAVRAISAALGLTWYEAYDLLCDEGRRSCNMPSGDEIWGNVLLNHGFRRYAIPNNVPLGYAAEDFAIDHPDGVYVLAFGGHVATVRDGVLMDSWDSSQEIPIYYYRRP